MKNLRKKYLSLSVEIKFIIGDLNMDLKSLKGNPLRDSEAITN